MKKAIVRFLKEEDGPTAVEYAVMLMTILLACVGSIQVISSWIYNSFSNSSTEIGNYMS